MYTQSDTVEHTSERYTFLRESPPSRHETVLIFPIKKRREEEKRYQMLTHRDAPVKGAHPQHHLRL